MANLARILYLRWEYTDIPHVWGRYLFTMNPDGTCQREFYGSGSYWPNAIFYARAVPDHPSKVVGIVTGHHVGRVGELVIFDPAQGRKGNEGVVQRIPGRAKPVEPVILDRLTEDSWPKFLHPFPLSEKYFLAAAKPTPADLWGIYLVDVFDNILLLKEGVPPLPLPGRRGRRGARPGGTRCRPRRLLVRPPETLHIRVSPGLSPVSPCLQRRVPRNVQNRE